MHTCAVSIFRVLASAAVVSASGFVVECWTIMIMIWSFLIIDVLLMCRTSQEKPIPVYRLTFVYDIPGTGWLIWISSSSGNAILIPLVRDWPYCNRWHPLNGSIKIVANKAKQKVCLICCWSSTKQPFPNGQCSRSLTDLWFWTASHQPTNVPVCKYLCICVPAYFWAYVNSKSGTYWVVVTASKNLRCGSISQPSLLGHDVKCQSRKYCLRVLLILLWGVSLSQQIIVLRLREQKNRLSTNISFNSDWDEPSESQNHSC